MTTVYDHNFFTLDGKTTGPDNVVRFPFAVKASRPLNGMLEVRGRELAIARAFEPKENIFTELEGFGPAASDYGFEMENRATGAGVRVDRGSAAGQAGVLVGLPDRVPGAVHRRQRRARTHHVVAAHLHVLRRESRLRRGALKSRIGNGGAGTRLPKVGRGRSVLTRVVHRRARFDGGPRFALPFP